MNISIRTTLILIPLLAHLFCSQDVFSATEMKIEKLKNLYINTDITVKGKAGAVIVAPSHYNTTAVSIQKRIKELSGVELPILGDGVVLEEILGKTHVIAVGNMSTNRFIEQLYCQWYVILDLKYPGEGGYVVRSLHNPYGTGKNVIFIGGSDDKGVEEAACVFVDILKPGKPLRVGVLMKIKLGRNMKPPIIGETIPDWVVYSWNDSWRKGERKKEIGYRPSTFFGWNSISIAGILYYMTGREEYLDYFKAMAMPDPKRIPLANRTDDSFTDPLNPLVKNYHYRSHLLDCIYDLIEESPLFTDHERLFITKKLLERQYEYDPDNTFPKPNLDRHGLWHMLNIYTGSRYFSKYYSNPVWNQRIENVRQAFSSFINNPTWGERDTLEWVSTSTEPLFEFFMLDGFDDFVKSGTARTMMSALEILMTGDNVDYYNKYVSIGLLHKAAYMLNDPRYVWMARQLGFDFNVFRIGQSYWPSDTMHVLPPVDLTEKIQIYPLARTDWKKADELTPFNKSFQLLSYRTGLSRHDDYFLVDGFEGLGRNPYHVNTLLKLRMFNGKNILDGYLNSLNIWLNGMSDPIVARTAALTDYLSDGDIAYMGTEVPSMSSMKWKRHLLYMKDRGTLVIDKLVAQKTGTFEIVCSWQFGSSLRANPKPSLGMEAANGAKLSSSSILFTKIENNIAQGKIRQDLQGGEVLTVGNIFSARRMPLLINEVEKGIYRIEGNKEGVAVTGNHSSESMTVKAEFAYFDKDTVLVVEGTELVFQNEVVFKSDKPATFLWRLTQGRFTVSPAQEALHLKLAKEVGKEIEINREDHAAKQIKPRYSVVMKIVGTLKQMESRQPVQEIVAKKETAKETGWEPGWATDLKGKITNLSPSSSGIWAVTQSGRSSRVSKIAFTGDVSKTLPFTKNILSIWSVEENDKGAPGLLVGFEDDILRAFSGNGELLWSVTASIHESFKIGNRYAAPWFTDPRYKKGIYSILVQDIWGSGKEEIVIGRPSTLEFHALNGDLIARVPTRSGDNTSLGLLKKTGVKKGDRLLLAGKLYTGNPGISGVKDDYTNVSDHLFDGVSPGLTSMHAWLQRGLSHLRVADINYDGNDEVIYNLSGHWNELRVYSGATTKPLWMHYFGPDKAGGDFMRVLVIADFYGDSYRQVIVATKNGWVCAFDHNGRSLWQQCFKSPIKSMISIHDCRQVAVGCEDGTMAILDNKGKVVKNNTLESSVNTLLYTGHVLFAGTEKGLLSKYVID